MCEYNDFKYIKDISGVREDTLKESCEYKISDFNSKNKILYTGKLEKQSYTKKIIIYEICKELDVKYFDYPIYSGNHTFYMDIDNSDYGYYIEKWLKTDLFKTIYTITKSSQYIKSGLIRHIKIPSYKL